MTLATVLRIELEAPKTESKETFLEAILGEK